MTSALLLTAACAPLAPRPTAADALRAHARWPETTLAELERGRSLFLGRCTSCHRPVEPASIAAERWPDFVADMRKRAHLDDREVALVVRYLATMSAAGP